MDPINLFWAYASKFEEAYVSDDWSLLIPFFSEDAVYETIATPPLNNLLDGRDAVLAGMKASVNGLDRRFETRQLGLDRGPFLKGDDTVWMVWKATYTYKDLPPLEIAGEEAATFAEGKINRLEDRYSDEMAAHYQGWLDRYASQLPPIA